MIKWTGETYKKCEIDLIFTTKLECEYSLPWEGRNWYEGSISIRDGVENFSYSTQILSRFKKEDTIGIKTEEEMRKFMIDRAFHIVLCIYADIGHIVNKLAEDI